MTAFPVTMIAATQLFKLYFFQFFCYDLILFLSRKSNVDFTKTIFFVCSRVAILINTDTRSYHMVTLFESSFNL